YFQWIGREFGQDLNLQGDDQSRRLELKRGMTAIHSYELELSRALLSALEAVPGLRLYGLNDPDRLEQRVATFSFRLRDVHPRTVAEKLAEQGLYVWDGNYYALNVAERLGLEESGGMVRVGAVHYNTFEEVERLKNGLLTIAGAS
ncbi:MAG: aminotransferase class V-fold PLP-dependent enzyme, partial [Chloroflexota bacterium]|nr:aminotransferase class V-fold PLP-dependent enzyme [Chloroflexota bacterium]